MNFKKIKISNFCGIKSLESDLYHNTIIKGKNAVGKSTIRNAIFFVLFNKMADGSSADSIRPHDENGVDTDFIEISVELTTEIDGRDVVFKKTQKQNWVKDRTTQNNVFKGNVNEYEINGIPKNLKDYEAYIADNITALDKLMLCINPFIFLNLDAKKRRAKLFEMVEDFDNADVIATNEDFKAIENDLKDGSVDELITRSRKIINESKKELEIIPARIDELSNQINTDDLSVWDNKKTEIEGKIANNTRKRKTFSLQIEDYDKAQVELLQMEMDLNEIVRKSTKDLIDRKSALNEKIAFNQHKLSAERLALDVEERKVRDSETEIVALEESIENSRKEYKELKAMKFDESQTICSFCGQPLPGDKVEEIVSNYENVKKVRLDAITKVGNANNELIKNHKKAIKDGKANIVVCQNNIKAYEDQLDMLEKALDDLADELDVTTIPEYVVMEKAIAEKKAMIEKFDVKALKTDLENELTDLNNEMVEVERNLSVRAFNRDLQKRIDVLKAKQIDTAQLIADEEKKLDLLSQFQRAKVGMITDKINSYFTVIKFRLFRQLINGGYEECCEPLFNGTSYDKTLNHGAKILCEMDICQAFQKANNIQLPIIIDDSESVDSDRIPKLDTQVISIRRTDDEILTITEF